MDLGLSHAWFRSILASLSHGIGPYCSTTIANLIWKFTIYSIGLMSYFMLMSMLHHLFQFQFVIRVRWVLLCLLVIYLFALTNNDTFVNVIRFYVPLMIVALAGFLYSYYIFQSDGVIMIIIGILISFISSGVQQSGIILHKHMNYNDLAHIIQMASIWCFYLGSIVLKDEVI